MIDTTKTSTNVTAGTNATADQYNGIRTDMATGWVNPQITPTYNTVSGQVGTINVTSDATTLFEVGDKVRFKQGGGYLYFIVTAVTSTTLNITGGSEYTLTNAGITDFAMSKAVVPVDWPLTKAPLITLTDGATVTLDLNVSKEFQVTLGGNRTLAVSNAKIGDAFYLRIIQDATGSRTVSWFSTIKWPDSITPTLTTTANKTDVFGFVCTSSGNYDGYIVGQNL